MGYSPQGCKELDMTELQVQHRVGFPGGASGKEPTCQGSRRERPSFDPWVRKIPGAGHDNPLQYSSLENPMDLAGYGP